MIACDTSEAWTQFLEYVKNKSTPTAFGNWFAAIRVIEATPESIKLEIPNVFVREYILSNYKKELCSFLPMRIDGEPAVEFIIPTTETKANFSVPAKNSTQESSDSDPLYAIKLNENYRFTTFIEGANNQFVKSAAMGVAARPGQSYNPLFIHGGVGLGKTHILHSIGHHILDKHRKLRVQCITTEGFINDLVDSLRKKAVDKMKRFYRSDVDVLLVDDIQFLQNRLNFEEEFCHTFETLINQNKQIVITSDKPPQQLKLSERMIARMEWGLVAHMDMPDLETRVAILQHKAEQKGLELTQDVAFFMAERLHHNVRQLEGAINRLSAQCRLLNLSLTSDVVQNSLSHMLRYVPLQKVSIDQILKGVAAIFQIRVSDLKGTSRHKEIALPRQIAMYLAKEFLADSLTTIGSAFGKTHSTILHACKNVEKRIAIDDTLRRQLTMIRRNIES